MGGWERPALRGMMREDLEAADDGREEDDGHGDGGEEVDQLCLLLALVVNHSGAASLEDLTGGVSLGVAAVKGWVDTSEICSFEENKL